ncbi:L-fucose/L-arabinose isomerase family protein [Clostridium beijerinckii]|uniref:L-fucose/L-arabinose isomerase family protein n=1 Tax=Clostridium beijerinckii TaxID=1520 RepID=UPI0022E58933|nr:sugar isomerase [Clostridium beijerinckii]
MDIKVAFIPLARTTFFMPSAEENFTKSCDMLEGLFGNVNKPTELITSPEMLGEFADTLSQQDLIIYQCSTFIGGDFVTELTNRFNCPIIVWAVREPSIDGGRLKLNSLTGAFSAGNSLRMQGRQHEFVFGNPDEIEVIEKLRTIGAAVEMVKKLNNLVIGVVGSQPAGFGFGVIDEAQLASTFGIKVAQVEAANLMSNATSYNDEEIATALEELKSRTKGWDLMPKENLEKYARLRTAYQGFIKESGAGAIASRCWPDFFTGFGAPVCAVLSMLNDNGIPSSCETDMGGAISMFIGSNLSGSATYFGDPVAVDEKCDSIVYWHCGAGASSLANKNEGSKLGVHPNRKIGPTMEFGLKNGPVTVLRLGKDKDGFRMFLMKGEALDEPQKFWGTSVTVKPEGGQATESVAAFVEDGWEPHFVIAYGNVVEEVKTMCNMLGINVWEY